MSAPLRVLMIDDDSDDQMFFEIAASELNFPVKCLFFNDCYLGLEMLNSQDYTPDFIFIDINMPKMNGLECLEAIKKMARLRDVPVYLYSTSNQKSMADKCVLLGGCGLIKKEASIVALRDILRITFEKHLQPPS